MYRAEFALSHRPYGYWLMKSRISPVLKSADLSLVHDKEGVSTIAHDEKGELRPIGALVLNLCPACKGSLLLSDSRRSGWQVTDDPVLRELVMQKKQSTDSGCLNIRA